MKTEEKDKLAKDAARRGMRATSVAASRPGAVAVGADEASRIDQRIAEKQQQGVARAAARSTKSEAVTAASGTKKQQGQFDADVAAKQRGRSQGVGVALKPAPIGGHATRAPMESDAAMKIRLRNSAAPSTPGAHSVSNQKQSGTESVSSATRRELSNLEEDASMISGSPSSRGVKKVPSKSSNHEDRVAAKIRRETSSTTPSVRAKAELPPSLEDRVSAKIQGEKSSSTRRKGSDPPGFHSVKSTTLEDSVSAKIRRETSSNPGAYSEKTTLEDSVTAKIRRGTPGPQPMSTKLSSNPSSSVFPLVNNADSDQAARLDARIAAKTATMTIPKNETVSKKEIEMVAPPSEKAPTLAKEGTTKTIKTGGTSKLDEKAKLSKDDPEKAIGQMGMSTVGGFFPDSGFGEQGLAIAVAVEEDDDDIFIPSAIEYDPDAKPPIYKNRRFRLYGFLACIILVLVVIGAGLGGSLGSNMDGDATPAPTSAPTTFRESLGIKTQIIRVVGTEVLEDPESPYSKALEWITFDDPMQLTPDAPSFIQRFTSAYLYFSSTEEGPWRSCNPTEDPWNGETSCDFEHLTSIFPLTFEPIPSHAWLSNITECDWAGTICDEDGQVRAVDLSAAGMSGTFPEGIKNWPFLQALVFTWCNLRGPLPPELVKMKHLITLDLHFNMFTGTVPQEWWEARNLQRMNVGDNFITGSIPGAISNLNDLKGFFMFTNLFSGSLPPEIGSMDSLTYWRAQRNNFVGEIPSTIQDISLIQEFWMHRCKLTGSLPETIGGASTLQDLRFQDNPDMTGTIPDSLYNLDMLGRLDLYDCGFRGTISTKIGNLQSLYTLRVSNNNFRGSIPTEMGELSGLYTLWMEGNAFTGTVPRDVCFNATDDLALFDSFSADCAPNENGVIELECPCCTECCIPDGTQCLPTTTDA